MSCSDNPCRKSAFVANSCQKSAAHSLHFLCCDHSTHKFAIQLQKRKVEESKMVRDTVHIARKVQMNDGAPRRGRCFSFYDQEEEVLPPVSSCGNSSLRLASKSSGDVEERCLAVFLEVFSEGNDQGCHYLPEEDDHEEKIHDNVLISSSTSSTSSTSPHPHHLSSRCSFSPVAGTTGTSTRSSSCESIKDMLTISPIDEDASLADSDMEEEGTTTSDNAEIEEDDDGDASTTALLQHHNKILSVTRWLPNGGELVNVPPEPSKNNTPKSCLLWNASPPARLSKRLGKELLGDLTRRNDRRKRADTTTHTSNNTRGRGAESKPKHQEPSVGTTLKDEAADTNEEEQRIMDALTKSDSLARMTKSRRTVRTARRRSTAVTNSALQEEEAPRCSKVAKSILDTLTKSDSLSHMTKSRRTVRTTNNVMPARMLSPAAKSA